MSDFLSKYDKVNCTASGRVLLTLARFIIIKSVKVVSLLLRAVLCIFSVPPCESHLAYQFLPY